MINTYTPRSLTHEGCARSNRANSWNSARSDFKRILSTTINERCNNEESWKESNNIRIPSEILGQSINLVESIRKLIDQNDKTPRFYVHRTNKKYYEKYNIKTPTDFSIYILNLCEEYLKKIDTKGTEFIKNNLQYIEKIQNQLYHYKTTIENHNAIDDHTKDLLDIISLQIDNLLDNMKII